MDLGRLHLTTSRHGAIRIRPYLSVLRIDNADVESDVETGVSSSPAPFLIYTNPT